MDFTLPALQFRQMLTGCLISAAQTNENTAIYSVFVELEGRNALSMVSTDRYRMAWAETTAAPRGQNGSVLMKRDNADTVLKIIPAKPDPDLMIRVFTIDEVGGYKVSLGYPSGVPNWITSFTAEPSAFPKWRSLIPSKPEATETISFDPKFMADLAKFPRDRKKPMTWSFNGTNRPALATWSFNDIDWSHLLMPVRKAP